MSASTTCASTCRAMRASTTPSSTAAASRPTSCSARQDPLLHPRRDARRHADARRAREAHRPGRRHDDRHHVDVYRHQRGLEPDAQPAARGRDAAQSRDARPARLRRRRSRLRAPRCRRPSRPRTSTSRTARFGLPKDARKPLCDLVVPREAPHLPMMGSTDVADVSWVVPLVQMHGATFAIGTPVPLLAAGRARQVAGRPQGYGARRQGHGRDRARRDPQPRLVARAKADLAQRTAEAPYRSPIPDGVKPPVGDDVARRALICSLRPRTVPCARRAQRRGRGPSGSGAMRGAVVDREAGAGAVRCACRSRSGSRPTA